MALIEGVGDEVTLLFGVLLLILILLLAWISTGTSEPPEHLFVSATAPTPLLGTSPAQRDSLLSSADTSSSSTSSSASSVSESSQAEVPPSTPSNQEAKDEESGRAGALGQGLRSRDRGGEGGEGESGGESSSSSSQRNMVVRLKFLNDTERTAQVKPQDTIGYIKRWALHTQTLGMQQQFPHGSVCITVSEPQEQYSLNILILLCCKSTDIIKLQTLFQNCTLSSQIKQR